MNRMKLGVALVVLLAVPAVARAQMAEGGPGSANIVTVAAEAGDFTTLVKALKAAGLVETLQGKGPFTVFAPTDEAFAKLPAGTLDALLQDPEKLRSVLTYHVVSGQVPASEAMKLSHAETVNGASLALQMADGHLKVDGATVVKADIGASNGVIHVIDRVLLPPSMR